MEYVSSSVPINSKEQVEGEGEQRPKAVAVKGERIAQNHGAAFLVKGLDLFRMSEVEGHLAEMLVASLRLETQRAEHHVLEPRREIRVQRRGALGGGENGGLETLNFAVGKTARERF